MLILGRIKAVDLAEYRRVLWAPTDQVGCKK